MGNWTVPVSSLNQLKQLSLCVQGPASETFGLDVVQRHNSNSWVVLHLKRVELIMSQSQRPPLILFLPRSYSSRTAILLLGLPAFCIEGIVYGGG